MQILIVSVILLAVTFIGYLLFIRKKKPAVTELEVIIPDVIKKKSPVIIEDTSLPTPEQKTAEIEGEQSKTVKKAKAKPVKKEKKSKDKGNDMLLS
jgi:hypothetical protein